MRECVAECVLNHRAAVALTACRSHSKSRSFVDRNVANEKSCCAFSLSVFGTLMKSTDSCPDNCPGTSDYDPKRPMSGGKKTGRFGS